MRGICLGLVLGLTGMLLSWGNAASAKGPERTWELIRLTNQSEMTTIVEITEDKWKQARTLVLTPNETNRVPLKGWQRFRLRVKRGMRKYEVVSGEHPVGFEYVLNGNWTRYTLKRGEKISMDTIPRENLNFDGTEEGHSPSSN